ncbi:MAG TPA: hypothetical protein VNS08_05630 [Ureibacillus sp.]|nr:hypothetical protein [Ureibacillus sp.]
MNNDEQIFEEFQIAHLTQEQTSKLKQLESELGFTLIAYQHKDQQDENNQSFQS